uniref:Carboxypeptidase regulatory-like domain-containing protein n=1 Tax=Solibacter usitatus (strain Ellin6076) TaxID=234267 RepID=Q01UC6_SOLUE
MRRNLCIWFLAAIVPTLAPCQNFRRLTGTVLLPDGKPAQGAVVKLESQTGEIRTALSTANGSFQFSSLLTDTDYQVRARLGELESEKEKWSRWSSRKEREVILKLRVRRAANSSGNRSTANLQHRDGVVETFDRF